MKHLRLGARLLLLLMMVASGLMGSTGGDRAFAQGGATSFVSPMTGIPITTAGPWTVDPTSVMSQDGIESITLSAEFEFMQVWFMPGDVDLVEARDVVLDSFAQTFGTFVEIDRGAYGNVSYSLDITSSEGIEFGVFSLFLGQRDSGYVEYYVYFGALSLFAQGFASAQQNVTVNGIPVFGGVDGAGLQTLLLANAGVTGSSPSTTTQAPPVPTAEPQQPTQPPAQPTPPPAEPTQEPANTTQQTGGSLTPEQSTYLQTVRSEIDALEGSIFDFLVLFGEFSSGSASDQTITDMRSMMTMWAEYPQTSSSIVAPAGMEDVDAQFRSIGNAFATASSTFMSAMEAGANGDQAALDQGLSDFSTQLENLFLEISTLRGLIDQYEQAGGTTQQTDPPVQPTAEAQPTDPPAQPTAEAQPTQETTTTTTDAGDGDAYVAAISGETQAIMDSIVAFAEGVQMLGSADTAEQDQGVTQVNGVLDYWSTYDQVAAGIAAPAGFEDIDAAYQQLAVDVTELATLFDAWLNAPEASQATAGEEFSAALDDVQTQIENLNAMLGVSTSTSTGSTDAPEDITETGNRGQLPELPSGDDDTGSTGAADYEDLGLVSESEYVSPQFDIEVVWDDRWAFDGEAVEDAIGSSEEDGEDWITLIWTGGDSGDIIISVSEVNDFEPEGMVEYWESDEYLDGLPVPGEVVLSEASQDRGGVLILLDDGDGGAIYREAVCLSRSCDEVAFVMVISSVVDAPDLIADAEEGIEIEGEAATGVFSTREINRALDQ